MTDDLTTLLRDAGRPPTVDLDLDAVHARGRRRAAARRTTAGLGVLAVLGAVGLVVLARVPQAELPPIGEAPSTEASPSEAPQTGAATEAAAVTEVGTTPRVALAAELGRDLHLHRHDPADDSWTLERTSGNGATDVQFLTLPPMLGEPVVDRDGRVWTSDAEGGLRLDGQLPPEADARLAGAWLPVGTTHDGIAVAVSLLGSADGEDAPLLRALGPPGTVVSSRLDEVAAALPPGATVYAFAEGPDHAVVLGPGAPPAGVGGGAFVLLVPDDGAPRDLLGELPVADAVGGGTVTAVAIVDEEVWLAVAAPDDTVNAGSSSIVRVPMLPEGVAGFLPTPDPAGMHRLDGVVTAIEPGPDGEVVLLGRRDGDRFLPPLVVRPAMAEAQAAGAITQLDAAGVPRLLPATGGGCGSARHDTAPDPDGRHLWFACYGDGSSLDPFPFHRVDAEPLGVEAEDLLRGLVEQFLAGPAPEDEQRGVQPLAPQGGVALTDLATDGTRVTITVDSVAATGVPTGATDGWAFRVALAALALQFDAHEEVVVVADGVCGDWEGTTDPGAADDCIVWTEELMPWNQLGVTDLGASEEPADG